VSVVPREVDRFDDDAIAGEIIAVPANKKRIHGGWLVNVAEKTGSLHNCVLVAAKQADGSHTLAWRATRAIAKDKEIISKSYGDDFVLPPPPPPAVVPRGCVACPDTRCPYPWFQARRRGAVARHARAHHRAFL
jgi:hypothetical protein